MLKQVASVVVAVVLLCTVPWMIHMELHMVPAKNPVSSELVQLKNELLDQTSAIRHDVRKVMLENVEVVQEDVAAIRRDMREHSKNLVEIEERLNALSTQLSSVANALQDNGFETLPSQSGALANSSGPAEGFSEADYSQEENFQDEGDPAVSDSVPNPEIEALLRKFACPHSHPYPYKADDLVIPNHCCSSSLNCRGDPVSSTKEYECCGGDSVGMPIAYYYNGSLVQCQNYSWWRLLENASTPLWTTMKKAAQQAAPGVWAGNESRLASADAAAARKYVGSAWGRSGWRQFQTAKRFLELQSEHQFLEIGCGAMNAGQFFMNYLSLGKYVCVEPNAMLHKLSMSASETLQRDNATKLPLLIARDDFDPRQDTQRKFDRSWSHSILSHAADWQLMQYFEVMASVLKPTTGVGLASIRFSDATGSPEMATHDTSWVYPGVSYFEFPEAKCMAQRAGLDISLAPEVRLFMTEVVPAEHHDWIRMWIAK
mmetsp:Transcript_2087/g.4683  ORF Transcript_2087/g.4683 Transcript_2087/m.4683 type:complete len:487 (+) Transcript_2087:74-1534(+)